MLKYILSLIAYPIVRYTWTKRAIHFNKGYGNAQQLHSWGRDINPLEYSNKWVRKGMFQYIEDQLSKADKTAEDSEFNRGYIYVAKAYAMDHPIDESLHIGAFGKGMDKAKKDSIWEKQTDDC